MTAPQQETNGAPGRWVQHIYCSAIISKKMCDALTSYVFSVSAAKGGNNEFVVYLITGGGNPGSGMELYSWVTRVSEFFNSIL